MAIKDNPGIQTMPKTARDWTKFINDLSDVLDGIEVSGGGASGDFVTIGTDQTITGLKDFTIAPTINDAVIWNQDNVGTQVNSLTEDIAPDISADFILSYDASTDLPKKVLLTNITGAGVADDNELFHHWFDD